MSGNLRGLFTKHQTGKLGLRYDVAYEFLCSHLLARDNPRVLEIGVLDGASIKVWRDWFGPSVYIVAVDVNPANAANATVAADYVAVGDQSDVEFLKRVVEATGRKQFDLIIDDGSHLPQHQLATFEFLWPHVNPWGVYVIEDMGCNVGRYKTKWLSKLGGRIALDVLFGKVEANMFRRSRKPPEEFVCFCGEATFIVKIPKD